MTSGSTQRPELLTRDNSLLLLVDHQIGLYTGVRDTDVLQLKHNVVGLTRAMLALKVPVIVTTTTEKMWGPIIPELAQVLPGVQGIERTTVDASDGFSQTQVDTAVLRMQHAGVIPVCYSNVAVEIMADNAAPEAEAVYAALGMPFSDLVFGLKQYFSRS